VKIGDLGDEHGTILPARRRTIYASIERLADVNDTTQKSIKGRGALSRPGVRFDAWTRETDGDHLDYALINEEKPPLKTEVNIDPARTIISYNESPDIPFDRSINPYKGCEHGCIYCYARPSHAYLGLSPGLDFETKLFYKDNAAQLLATELSKTSYRPRLIALGANTDPYQPIEKKLGVTRSILSVLNEFNHPVAIVTKSALVERDIDILSAMAGRNLARVFVSITTLDHEISRHLEPRTSAPARRMQAVRALTSAGIPAGVMVAPVIPALTDKDIETVLEAAKENGAESAAYILLRLPFEVKTLFAEWLQQHFPQRASHVMSIIRQMRGGKDNDPNFGSRMHGEGEFANLLKKRFDIACQRLGLNQERRALDNSQFKVPAPSTGQLSLF
jgi:DNA repair photolyase